jgi:hypothetical protein
MMEMPIQPHEGIGPIKLGAARNSVRDAMASAGFPLSAERDKLDYFCGNAIQVEYDAGTASFIGVSSHCQIHCTFHGVDVFDVPATELFALVNRFEGEPTHDFNQQEYCFPTQVLTVWEADEQYHLAEAKQVYGQIGIGDQRYLDAVNKIKESRTNSSTVESSSKCTTEAKD